MYFKFQKLKFEWKFSYKNNKRAGGELLFVKNSFDEMPQR